MTFFIDLPEAFREGVLNATSKKRKIFAWSALIFLAVMALVALVSAIICFSSGFPIQGVTLSMNTLTFLFLCMTVIYQAATAEIQSKW